LVRGRHVEKQQ